MDIDYTSIDEEEFAEAKQLLGKRFQDMLLGYLEDTETYLQAISEGLKSNDLEKVAQGAHPLKSSSASLGICGIAHLAKNVELVAKNGGSVAEIEDDLQKIRTALPVVAEKIKAA